MESDLKRGLSLSAVPSGNKKRRIVIPSTRNGTDRIIPQPQLQDTDGQDKPQLRQARLIKWIADQREKSVRIPRNGFGADANGAAWKLPQGVRWWRKSDGGEVYRQKDQHLAYSILVNTTKIHLRAQDYYPPPCTVLDNPSVLYVLMACEITPEQRSVYWPVNFDSDGEVRSQQNSHGGSVIVIPMQMNGPNSYHIKSAYHLVYQRRVVFDGPTTDAERFCGKADPRKEERNQHSLKTTSPWSFDDYSRDLKHPIFHLTNKDGRDLIIGLRTISAWKGNGQTWSRCWEGHGGYHIPYIEYNFIECLVPNLAKDLEDGWNAHYPKETLRAVPFPQVAQFRVSWEKFLPENQHVQSEGRLVDTETVTTLIQWPFSLDFPRRPRNLENAVPTTAPGGKNGTERKNNGTSPNQTAIKKEGLGVTRNHPCAASAFPGNTVISTNVSDGDDGSPEARNSPSDDDIMATTTRRQMTKTTPKDNTVPSITSSDTDDYSIPDPTSFTKEEFFAMINSWDTSYSASAGKEVAGVEQQPTNKDSSSDSDSCAGQIPLSDEEYKKAMAEMRAREEGMKPPRGG